MDLSSMQGVMVIIGPILLAAVIAFALIRNRRARGDIDHTEAATRERYDQQDREDKAREA